MFFSQKIIHLALVLFVSSLVEAKSTFKWSSTKRLFSFGDSYTASGFDPTGTQPSDGNILGNPTFPGWTWPPNGNWLTKLTGTYNQTTTYTYNFAYGGATTDNAIIPPYAPTVKSFKAQVEEEFLPIYANGTRVWKSDNSLFTIWIGVNDVGWTAGWSNVTDANRTAQNSIFIENYIGSVEKLVKAGGKNFLILNCPATDLSDWASWNRDLIHKDIVYDSPAQYGISNVTGYALQVSDSSNPDQSYF
ncbi:hypothetical protein HK096_006925, partial [Nowakowskiella sp. JEL0078]